MSGFYGVWDKKVSELLLSMTSKVADRETKITTLIDGLKSLEPTFALKLISQFLTKEHIGDPSEILSIWKRCMKTLPRESVSLQEIHFQPLIDSLTYAWKENAISRIISQQSRPFSSLDTLITYNQDQDALPTEQFNLWMNEIHELAESCPHLETMLRANLWDAFTPFYNEMVKTSLDFSLQKIDRLKTPEEIAHGIAALKNLKAILEAAYRNASDLPHAKSDYIEYLKETETALIRLEKKFNSLPHTSSWKILSDIYVKISIGGGSSKGVLATNTANVARGAMGSIAMNAAVMMAYGLAVGTPIGLSTGLLLYVAAPITIGLASKIVLSPIERQCDKMPSLVGVPLKFGARLALMVGSMYATHMVIQGWQSKTITNEPASTEIKIKTEVVVEKELYRDPSSPQGVAPTQKSDTISPLTTTPVTRTYQNITATQPEFSVPPEKVSIPGPALPMPPIKPTSQPEALEEPPHMNPQFETKPEPQGNWLWGQAKEFVKGFTGTKGAFRSDANAELMRGFLGKTSQKPAQSKPLVSTGTINAFPQELKAPDLSATTSIPHVNPPLGHIPLIPNIAQETGGSTPLSGR